MLQFIINFHNSLTIAILILNALVVIYLTRSRSSNEEWTPVAQWLSVLFVTAVDLAILSGVLLWIFQARWSDPNLLLQWRHLVVMMFGWGMIRWGWYRTNHVGNPRIRYGYAIRTFIAGGIVLVLGTAQMLVR